MSISWRVRHIAVSRGIWVYPAFAVRKQAMDMTEYGVTAGWFVRGRGGCVR